MNIKDFIFSSKVLPPKGNGTASEPTIEPLSITENGTYTAPDGVDGYSPVTVEVEAEIIPNWTDWSYLFYNGARSDLIEKLKFTDSHNVVDFGYLFAYCTVTSIPELDTSNGKNFKIMFSGCSRLISIPELDTSNGTDFSSMFNSCSKLISIPKLNLSNGTNFNSMFGSCKALVEIGFEGTFNVSANNTTFLTTAPNVNQESLHKLIDCMVKTGTASTYTIGIGSSNLARVSEEYINKALEKGIVLQ